MANLFILIVSPCALAKKRLFWFYSRIICFYGVRECFAFAKGWLVCRLTRCPFSIWSVCWSPVKMVCPCVNVHFLVVRVNGCCVVLHLPVTVSGFAFGWVSE